MDHLHDLVEEASIITSITTGVYYNDDYNREDCDAMTPLLCFEPQEFVRPPSNTISIFDTDDKATSVCGQDVTISANGHQSVLMIVAEGQAPSASYHDFNIDHLITSVTRFVNITSGAGDSLSSGGEKGGGCVHVSLHDTTIEPSTCIKHAVNILRVMSTIIGTNELPCPF